MAWAPGTRWTAEEAWAWYEQQGWLCGFNYIPASAINYTEMWQRETYDPETIDAELELAQEVGFNCVRVVLQYLVWEDDPASTLERIDDFMRRTSQRGMRVMWCLFDDCNFGTRDDPYLGPQADVVPGFYANDWSPSPGHSMVRDVERWRKLESYVKEVVGAFKDDERVLAWDVYNEPNIALTERRGELVEKVFVWTRSASPSQPLTLAVWRSPQPNLDLILAHSDIYSGHIYLDAEGTKKTLAHATALSRPFLCTEWLNRPLGSSVQGVLPLFYEHNIGSFFWGLANGKTQTQYPWGSKAGDPEPDVWQHDLFRADQTPYDPAELALFKRYLAKGGEAQPVGT